jgi:uncharacterized protein YkwD
MMTIPTQNRTARHTLRASLVLAIALFSLVLTGCNASQQAALSQSMVNTERERAGAAPLAWDVTAANKAQAWADNMAARNTISHSNLTDGMGDGWSYLGENVGVGNSVDEVHKALMRSSSHRATIMAGRYSSVGIGVAERNGKLFVAQVFKG